MSTTRTTSTTEIRTYTTWSIATPGPDALYGEDYFASEEQARAALGPDVMLVKTVRTFSALPETAAEFSTYLGTLPDYTTD